MVFCLLPSFHGGQSLAHCPTRWRDLQLFRGPLAGLVLSLLPLLSPWAVRAEDLTVALNTANAWTNPDFLETWRPETAPTEVSHKLYPNPPAVFGTKPEMVTGLFQGGELRSITVLYLDSGTHFGYVSREDAGKETDRIAAFDHRFEETAALLRERLEAASGERGREIELGEDLMLRQPATIFALGDLHARFVAIDSQLLKLSFYRTEAEAASFQDPALAELDRRDLEDRFAAKVRRLENGDVLIDEVPLSPQGDRAYCGVSALAMAMQYLGLSSLETEDYAAAAGIRHGSTKGSKIKEIYGAAGEEAGFRMSRTTRFDFGKAKDAIEGGVPVLVWRRWKKERDYLHTLFARRFADDPTLTLPEPNAEDRATWPGESDYTHASVVNGYNEERGEVILTESWGEFARNRRMRIEELEATAYYAFYPRL